MPLQLRYTSDVTNNGVKCCIYGGSGVGKTHLVSTAPNPIILSAENGLLSVRKYNLPYLQITSMDDLVEAHQLIQTPAYSGYHTVFFDSLTEIAEVCLADLKSKNKDMRKAYGDVQESVLHIVRAFRDMPGKHVVMICKEEFIKLEDGSLKYGPMMPGNKLPQQVPFFFDELFQMVAMSVADETGAVSIRRGLRTAKDDKHTAKDRSGALASPWEVADLSVIFQKIMGATQ